MPASPLDGIVELRPEPLLRETRLRLRHETLTQLLPSRQPKLVLEVEHGGLRLIDPAPLREHHQRKVVIPPGSAEHHAAVGAARDVLCVTREEVISEAPGHAVRLI